MIYSFLPSYQPTVQEALAAIQKEAVPVEELTEAGFEINFQAVGETHFIQASSKLPQPEEASKL